MSQTTMQLKQEPTSDHLAKCKICQTKERQDHTMNRDFKKTNEKCNHLMKYEKNTSKKRKQDHRVSKIKIF